MSLSKKNRSSTIAILSGFATILILISVLLAISFYSLSNNSQSLDLIVSEQQHIGEIYTMRDAAQSRALKLFRMMTTSDYFAKDEIYHSFRDEAGRFVKAKEHFLASLSSEEKRIAWDPINLEIIKGSRVQNYTVQLIDEENYEAAKTSIVNNVIPIQDSVSNGLFKLLENQNKSIHNALLGAQKSNDLFFLLYSLLGVAVLLLGIFITYYVYNYNLNTEKELQQQQQAADMANQAKSSFLANMSHEIRTPLTAIIGFSEQVLNPSLNTNEQIELQKAIVKNSMHLQHLINDILDLSKIESGLLELELVSMSPSQVLYETESIISKRATDKGLYFEVKTHYPIPSSIISDAIRLKQVLLNLCSNAIKFTSEGGISLETFFNENENTLSISVKDTGTGLTSEQQKNIFNPFVQADVSTSRKFGGTGLGLSISLLLAKELEGTLECTSIIDKGSIFTFTIPTGVPGKIKMVTSNANYIPVTDNYTHIANVKQLQGHILLAEDTIDNQKLISLYVNQTGAHLDIVNNGEEVIQKALDRTYDLILMDMQMPVVDGIEATSTLRKLGYSSPIYSLTANVLAADREKCIAAGSDGFLAKPINVNEFYSVLNKYLPEQILTSQPANSNITSGFTKIKKNFIKDLPNKLSNINTALKNKIWEEIEVTSHYLNGIAGTFAFTSITEVSILLNNAVVAKEYDKVPALVKTLNETCNAIIDSNKDTSSATAV